MTPKKEADLKSYFKETINRNWQLFRCGGRREKSVKNGLKVLSLGGLSDTIGQSGFCGEDEFSFGCLEYEVLMRDPCSK